MNLTVLQKPIGTETTCLDSNRCWIATGARHLWIATGARHLSPSKGVATGARHLSPHWVTKVSYPRYETGGLPWGRSILARLNVNFHR